MQTPYALLSDAVQLAAAYQVPVTESALHVYHSALVTMPSCRLQELASKDNLLPVLISERPTSWSRILEGHRSVITSIAFSSDNQYIVSGGYDYTARLWDAATGIQLRIMGHGDAVTSVMFSDHGKNLRIVSGSRDCTVRVWDAMTGTQLRTMHHERIVNCVAFSRDGQLIVSGSADRTIRVWDASTGIPRIVLSGHTDQVLSVAFSSDSNLIVSGSEDSTLRVWDTATGLQASQLVATGSEDAVTFVTFSKDMRFIIAGTRYNIRVWSADTVTSVLTIDHPIGSPSSIAVSRNENLIASESHHGTIRLRDATAGDSQLCIEPGQKDWITSIAISDDGKLLAVGYRNGPLWVSKMTMSADVNRRNHTGHKDKIMAVAFSGDGMFIVSGSADCTAKVWSAKTGVELSTMSGHTKSVTSVALSGDGKLVVSGSADCTVRLWEAKTSTELCVYAGHQSPILSVALSCDDKLVASGSMDHTVQVWDVMAGTHLYIMNGHDYMVTSTAFSDDSRFIISGAYDETVRMWDVATGTHRQTITGHKSRSVAFLDDGNSVVSRLEDGMIQVWEASTAVAPGGLSTSLPQYVEAPDSPRHDRFKLERDGWIHRLNTANSWQRLCWLPSQRRGSELAYHGQTICIGTESGGITILDFSQVRIP
jgi:WD40 repeat protein